MDEPICPQRFIASARRLLIGHGLEAAGPPLVLASRPTGRHWPMVGGPASRDWLVGPRAGGRLAASDWGRGGAVENGQTEAGFGLVRREDEHS